MCSLLTHVCFSHRLFTFCCYRTWPESHRLHHSTIVSLMCEGQCQQIDLHWEERKQASILMVFAHSLFLSLTLLPPITSSPIPLLSVILLSLCWVMACWWRMLCHERWMWQADGFGCRLFNHRHSAGREGRALSCHTNQQKATQHWRETRLSTLPFRRGLLRESFFEREVNVNLSDF